MQPLIFIRNKVWMELNKNLPITSYSALVNPNYLNENPAYDVNGNKISVSERNSNWVLLVPDKYKNNENEIREFHQRWIDSFKGTINPKIQIEIIWTKSNQKFFSYDHRVNPDEGFYVTDPILFVGTEDGAYPGWNSQIFNVSGNPFKVRIEPGKTEEEFIQPVLSKFGYLSYGLIINDANEQVASYVEDYKDMFIWLATGIISTLIGIAVILVQNIYNFFEQYKVRLAIRQLHGYKKIEKYKEYFMLLISSWVITIILVLSLSFAPINVIYIVSITGFIVEFIVSIMMFSYIERKKVVEFIKGGA